MRKLFAAFVCMVLCAGVVQAQNNESMLNPKERQISAISGSAAKGDRPGLTMALSAGLDAGLTVNEIKEVLAAHGLTLGSKLENWPPAGVNVER